MSFLLGQGQGVNTSVQTLGGPQPLIDPVQAASVASATVVSPLAAAQAASGAASISQPIGILEPADDPWKNFILVGLLVYVIWLKTR